MDKLRGLTKAEFNLLYTLRTPIKIQNFLDTVPLNWEKQGETYMSPRRALRENKMHCFEGALVAALALWLHGKAPLLMDLRADGDDDHVVALYTHHGYWGAISKTNHATVRFRDPIYKTLRELALSYFHEYFVNDTGEKVLREYSARPFKLATYKGNWVTAETDLYELMYAVDRAAHRSLVPKRNLKLLRKADTMERQAGELREWLKTDPRT